MEYLIIYAILCLLIGWVASSTTLGFGAGFLLSIIFTPIVGFIITLFYPSREHRDRQTAALTKIANQTDVIGMEEKLSKLESMKEKNLITEGEYNLMRKSIIG